MVDRTELAQHLATVRESARQRWPGIDVELAAFVTHASERYPEGLALDRWCAEELYLAIAAAASDARALAIFDAEYVAPLDRVLARFADPALTEDTKQILRQRLLVRGDDGEPPRIASYTGKGSLAKWLEVSALRTAISLRRKDRDVPVEAGALTQLQGAVADPSLLHLKQAYLAQFTEAWRTTLRALDPRDRTLLRLHAVDRLSVERLGALYGVHPTTAARWIRQIRERIADGVRTAMQSMLSIGAEELAGIVALIQSQLDITLTELLSKDSQLSKSHVHQR